MTPEKEDFEELKKRFEAAMDYWGKVQADNDIGPEAEGLRDKIMVEMYGVEYLGLSHFYRAMVYLIEKYQAARARYKAGYHQEED
jgi:hypothetical protein